MKLLDKLSTATSTIQFGRCSTGIENLRDRLRALTLGSFEQLLSDGVFVRKLMTAACAGLRATRTTLSTDSLLSRTDSRGVLTILALLQHVLRRCWCLVPAAYTQAQHAGHVQDASLPAIRLLAGLLATMKQTGEYIGTMLFRCADNRSGGPTAVHATSHSHLLPAECVMTL